MKKKKKKKKKKKNFVELHCLMLHAKFQNHRPSGSEEEDF